MNTRESLHSLIASPSAVHRASRWHVGALLILLAAGICLIALPMHSDVYGQDSVVGSPHDLSLGSGPGRVHALEEDQVCIFCHAPHNTTGQAPLWNRMAPPTHYRIYESSTTDARIDQPSGPSKLCLSCHDGSLAIGLVASRPLQDPIALTHRRMPPGDANLGHDLSDDHPIGFRYDRPLARRDRQLRNPDLLTDQLPLGAHGELHCTTCHDPHDNSLGDFLREPTVRSTICLSCHEMDGWRASSHATSDARVIGRFVDPRDPLPHHTVADNACMNCHRIHSAPGRERLLRSRREEVNCLNCHRGGIAKANIAAEITKPSGHHVQRYFGRHDPAEDSRTMPAHVECADCHNPHAAQGNPALVWQTPTLGQVDGTLREVSGVGRSGRAVEASRFEYEVCFKCHADQLRSNVRPVVTRQITQTNTRREFQPSNPSYHPVIGPRNNRDVVSLIPPLRVGSVIRCTDCHNSDRAADAGTGVVRGPHGSIYAPLLIENLSTDDCTRESPQAYALCYRCHDRQSILNDESFPLHRQHVVRGQTPCSACHDAHGVSRLQGNSTNNSNLINFDRSIVQPASSGLGTRVLFEDRGPYRGSCTLTCHGVTHVRFEYGSGGTP
jgi:predicted CXXCH cytochrome family protein